MDELGHMNQAYAIVVATVLGLGVFGFNAEAKADAAASIRMSPKCSRTDGEGGLLPIRLQSLRRRRCRCEVPNIRFWPPQALKVLQNGWFAALSSNEMSSFQRLSFDFSSGPRDRAHSFA